MRLMLISPGASVSTIDVHNGYVKALKKLGHEVYVYALERRIDRAAKWLYWMWRSAGKPDPKPNGIDTAYWAGTYCIEMALRLEPDWVIVMSGMYLLKDTMLLLRKAIKPWAKLALILSESPYDDQQQLHIVPIFDAVFTNERTSVATLRIGNTKTYYLPHAYDAETHGPNMPLADDVPAHDVVFVGSCFGERIELLSAVDWSGIDLALYGPWGDLGSRSRLRRYVKAGIVLNETGVVPNKTSIVPNEMASMLYRRAKIGLNLYRESVGFGRHAERVTSAESLNPRAYELAACGAFQVSSYRAEVEERFHGAVPTFRSPRELELLLRNHLNNGDGRRRVLAEDARQHVAGQSYDDRAKQLLEVLQGAAVAAA